MSERIVPIQARVSTSALERAAVRLHSGKHVGKLAVIHGELLARRAEERTAAMWRDRKAA